MRASDARDVIRISPRFAASHEQCHFERRATVLLPAIGSIRVADFAWPFVGPSRLFRCLDAAITISMLLGQPRAASFH